MTLVLGCSLSAKADVVVPSFASDFESPGGAPSGSLGGLPSDWDFSFAFGGPSTTARGLTSTKAFAGTQSYGFDMSQGGAGAGQGLVHDLTLTGTIVAGDQFDFSGYISEDLQDPMAAGWVGLHLEFFDVGDSLLFDTFTDSFEPAVLRPIENSPTPGNS